MRKPIRLLLLSVAVVLTSCESLLDHKPESTLSPENFFKNETELRSFSNKFYTQLPSASILEEAYDNYTLENHPAEVRGGRQIPGSGNGWSWEQLRDINTMIEYSVNCTDEAVRTRYVALARFFRAYFYFEKVKRFGDVPWYDTQLGSASPELYKPRDSRELVMQNMIQDIDFAIENLPSGKSVYTITKWTAMALKTRFLLFEGTFRKYHAGDVFLQTLPPDAMDWKWYLQLAAETAKTFIGSSGYTIYNKDGAQESYLKLFAETDADPTEVILARDYSLTMNVVHNGTFYFLGDYGHPGMTRKMVASYLCADGSRFTDKNGWETMTFAEETQNRDPRLAQTIRTPGYHRIGTDVTEAPNFAVCLTGYHNCKFMQGKDLKVDSYGKSYNDIILFRAGEVYLNYAEAKAELGTLTQDDIDLSIKPLRDRVGMPNMNLEEAKAHPDPYLLSAEGGYPHVDKSMGFEGVILEIRRERTIELMKEGFRYYDLMRWKEGLAFTQDFYGMYFPGLGEYDLDGNGSLDVCLYQGDTRPASSATLILKVGSAIRLEHGTYGRVMPHQGDPGRWNEERDYLYPIPTDDRALTKGAITQNPGWDDGLYFE